MQLSLFLDRVLAAVTGPSAEPPSRRAATERPQEPEGRLGARESFRATPPPATTDGLIVRLKLLGLPRFTRISAHRNAQVMLSFVPGQMLRVHEGYAHAPDEVLQAIVRFVTPGIRRPIRLAAKRLFLDFPAEEHAPSRRTDQPPSRVAPADQPLVDRLRQLHEMLNARHFAGALQPVMIRISGRMRQRLGEVRLERKSGRPVHIGISRRHIRRDGWISVEETLLHEMVHQWQAETGRPVDHGPEFRRKARELGITPRAVRKGDP